MKGFLELTLPEFRQFFVSPLGPRHQSPEAGYGWGKKGVQHGSSLGHAQLSWYERSTFPLPLQCGEVKAARGGESVRQERIESIDLLLKVSVEGLHLLFLITHVIPLGLPLPLAKVHATQPFLAKSLTLSP